ncbi:unnamed protein product [Pelagomonas calceolata]|uniref:SAM domain-containing protein n=1 Tax=Pelagomonas calceolata TaxID=35677 RepID=A0A8J2SRQ0_9STRA|nr:unnamed protein product [Pelagomonas calceolata]
MALIKLIALAAVAPPAAPLVPRARRRAPLLRRASTQQGTLPPEESAAPDWEAMWAGGGASKEPAPAQRPGPVIRGVSASPAAAAREGFDACVEALKRLNIDARIDVELGDDDGWCRVGVDFQNDVLEAHRRGLRCVFIKQEEERQNDAISSATPPAEGTQKTYTAMGSETYLQDSLLEDFADGVVSSWSEVPDVVAEWTSSATEDLSPAVFAEQLVKAAGGGEFWPRFLEEGIQDVATLKLLTEEDLKELGLPLGCRRRLLAALN